MSMPTAQNDRSQYMTRNAPTVKEYATPYCMPVPLTLCHAREGAPPLVFGHVALLQGLRDLLRALAREHAVQRHRGVAHLLQQAALVALTLALVPSLRARRLHTATTPTQNTT